MLQKILIVCLLCISLTNGDKVKTNLELPLDIIQNVTGVVDMAYINEVLARQSVPQFVPAPRKYDNPHVELLENQTSVMALLFKDVQSYNNQSKGICVDGILDEKTGISAQLDDIARVLIESNGYLSQLHSNYKKAYPCSNTSLHTVIYELLQSYIATETICLKNILTCLDVHSDLNNNVSESKIESTKNTVTKRVRSTVQKFQQYLSISSTSVTRCVSGKHIPGETYTYFKSLFQKLIAPAKDLFDVITFPGCPTNNVDGLKTNNFSWPLKDCSNAIACKRAEFQPTVCIPNSPGERRYQSVTKYQKDYQPSCPDGYVRSNCKWQGPFYSRTLFCPEACDCICDEDKNSKTDRYVSLEEMSSDIKNNKVIVGLKLRKENHTLSIDIQEAELLSGAKINGSSSKWKSIFDDESSKKQKKLHKLSWYGNRGITLDFVKVPAANYCITGIKFNTKKIGSENFVTLEIVATMMNFTSGNLIENTSRNITVDETLIERNTYDITDREAPVDVKEPLKQNCKENDIVRFTPTGYFTNDAGQTTVPYINIQEIETSQPLQAAGLILVDSPKSGGFIKLGVETFNYTSFV